MGTLDREKGRYEWVDSRKEGICTRYVVSPSTELGTHDELYRLACEVEDLKADVAGARSAAGDANDRARTASESARRLELALKYRNQELARQAGQIQNQARTIAEMERKLVDASGLHGDNDRQRATIKSLREQLLANVDKSIANVLGGKEINGGGYPPAAWTRPELERARATLADHGAILKTHESRLDAMEEVFDKIKDAL